MPTKKFSINRVSQLSTMKILYYYYTEFLGVGYSLRTHEKLMMLYYVLKLWLNCFYGSIHSSDSSHLEKMLSYLSPQHPKSSITLPNHPKL